MRRLSSCAAAIAAVVLVVPMPAAAAPILPPGSDPELHAHMARQQRQFREFNAYAMGVSLNVHVKDAAARQKIDDFLAQDAVPDFRTFAGASLHDFMTGYGEHGDLGFFGGVALVGTAFRYLALQREGAPAAQVDPALADVKRAARSWHVAKQVTGGGGIVARGIWRRVPEDPADSPVPGGDPAVVPLADAEGHPLPAPKDNGSWRADLSNGVLPTGTWMWVDSCSKDQMSGQVLGMVALYEALSAAPEPDTELLGQIADDARAIAGMLMQKREISGLEGPVGEGEYDLMILDADGRPTMFHDLNPSSIEKIYVPEGEPGYNLFNLMLAVGVMKGLHHVSGDPAIERFLYEDLLGKRGWLERIRTFESPDAVNYIYMGDRTNTDNPDMTAVALFLALYLETDPEVRGPLHRFLEEGWWNPAGQPQAASKSKQPLWHAIWLALTGTGAQPGVTADLARLLKAFPLGPYWDDPRFNCDAAELEAKSCVALDGETVLTLVRVEDGQGWASEALDPSIRPTSDFNARSNSFRVNGGADGRLLNPGGDLLAAYWLARFLEAPGGTANVSPHALAHMPVGGEVPDAGPEEAGTDLGGTDLGPADAGPTDAGPTDVAEEAAAADAGPDLHAAEPTDVPPDEGSGGSGGGCSAGGPAGGAWMFLLAGLFLFRSMRRRGA